MRGPLTPSGRVVRLPNRRTYHWTLTAFSTPLIQDLQQWLSHLPPTLALKPAPLNIRAVKLNPAPTTYDQLWRTEYLDAPLKLSFQSPTSFRYRGEHLPLPWPRNLFHSYLRRWNLFSGHPIEPEPFLDWVDASVLIRKHHLQSVKVYAGRRGIINGFTGAVELGLTRTGVKHPDYPHLFQVLGRLAPYCGTGHKTPFGLGQTRLGWTALQPELTATTAQTLLSERIEQLTQTFLVQRQRQGGTRAQHTAETWATILARRELGDSLQDIAQDLDMRYETVKTYAKLARRSLGDRNQR